MNPTICYPYHLIYRKNFKYWIKLKSGRYVITERANVLEIVRVWYSCKAENLTFKIEPCEKTCKTALLLLLYLFYNRLTDRKPESVI